MSGSWDVAYPFPSAVANGHTRIEGTVPSTEHGEFKVDSWVDYSLDATVVRVFSEKYGLEVQRAVALWLLKKGEVGLQTVVKELIYALLWSS